MLATPQMFSLIGPGLPTASTTSEKTTRASTTSDTAVVARTRPGDDELTSLSWLHNPGVLNSMCNALTGSPHRVSALGSRSARKPQGEKGLNKAPDDRPRKGVGNSTEKMLNVVLSVRNRRYNGEDAQKPPLSFACMIFMALESSPTKTLPVKQIYEWMQWKFPYYRTTPPGWKNSVRHNLSLIKCFKKVEKFSRKTRSAVTKGGLWTTDPEYRESLLEALKLNPYHPYHKYFTAPYFPRSMISALRDELELAVTDKGLGPAERDAALSMCMISGADNYLDYMLIRAVYHDHSYTQLPTPPSSPSRPGVSLDEVAAAAEMILGGCEEVTSHRPRRSRRRRRRGGRGRGRKAASVDEEDIEDEAYNSDKQIGDEGEESTDFSLADSGYSGSNSPQLSHESRSSSIDDLRGADALLCLAKNATCPLPHEPQ